jgi:zeaxanthin glucosyltransferase
MEMPNQLTPASSGIKVRKLATEPTLEVVARDALCTSALTIGNAPQLELLEKADLTLTHGGLNTVLDSLSCAVPMVLVPLTYEQPAIAVRVARIGAGKILPLSRVSPEGLRSEIRRVMAGPAYSVNARAMAASIRAAGGVIRATEIIENAQGSFRIFPI